MGRAKFFGFNHGWNSNRIGSTIIIRSSFGGGDAMSCRHPLHPTIFANHRSFQSKSSDDFHRHAFTGNIVWCDSWHEKTVAFFFTWIHFDFEIISILNCKTNKLIQVDSFVFHFSWAGSYCCWRQTLTICICRDLLEVSAVVGRLSLFQFLCLKLPKISEYNILLNEKKMSKIRIRKTEYYWIQKKWSVPFKLKCSLLMTYLFDFSCNFRVRGTLGSMMILFCNLGVLTGFVLANFLDYYGQIKANIMLPTFFLLIFNFFPETPEYLLKCNQKIVRSNCSSNNHW